MSEQKAIYTPNIKKLIIKRMSMLALPPGSKNPLLVGARVFLEPDYFLKLWQKAEQWVREAIERVKQTSDNPWGDDDEAIAKAILEEETTTPTPEEPWLVEACFDVHLQVQKTGERDPEAGERLDDLILQKDEPGE